MLRTLLCAVLLCSAAAKAAGVPDLTRAPSALSVTVQPKDTAYAIAKKYGLSVDALLALNHLSRPDLVVGQVLQVAAAAPAPLVIPAPLANASALPAPGTSSTYTVVKGDTAFSIARRSNLSVEALLSLNHLSGANLSVGQVLSLGGAPVDTGAAAAPTPVPAAVAAAKATFTVTPAVVMLAAPVPDPNDLADAAPTSVPATTVQITASVTSVTAAPSEDSGSDWLVTAQSLLGVPYAYGGKSRSGTDCSGLVFQVFSPLGLHLPRTSAEQAQVGMPVDRSALQSGDLVFFDTEGRGKVTHVGIVVGGTTFINANSFAGKVAIDDLSSSYWASRYLGARRVLGIMAASH